MACVSVLHKALGNENIRKFVFTSMKCVHHVMPCEDPESFVRGGPNLKTFF